MKVLPLLVLLGLSATNVKCECTDDNADTLDCWTEEKCRNTHNNNRNKELCVTYCTPTSYPLWCNKILADCTDAEVPEPFCADFCSHAPSDWTDVEYTWGDMCDRLVSATEAATEAATTTVRPSVELTSVTENNIVTTPAVTQSIGTDGTSATDTEQTNDTATIKNTTESSDYVTAESNVSEGQTSNTNGVNSTAAPTVPAVSDGVTNKTTGDDATDVPDETTDGPKPTSNHVDTTAVGEDTEATETKTDSPVDTTDGGDTGSQTTGDSDGTTDETTDGGDQSTDNNNNVTGGGVDETTGETTQGGTQGVVETTSDNTVGPEATTHPSNTTEGNKNTTADAGQDNTTQDDSTDTNITSTEPPSSSLSCYECSGNSTTCGDDNWVKTSDKETCAGSGSSVHCWVILYKANGTHEDFYERKCDKVCGDPYQSEVCEEAAGQRSKCSRCCTTDNCNSYSLTGMAGAKNTLAYHFITWLLVAVAFILK